jgi:integrase
MPRARMLPQVQPRTERPGSPWVFRYWVKERQPDGTVARVRKYHEAGPSQGRGALTKEEAEAARDRFLAGHNAPRETGFLGAEARRVVTAATTTLAAAAVAQEVAAGGALFADAARLYQESFLSRDKHVSKPTRDKETHYIRAYLMPRWGTLLMADIQARNIEQWLHHTFDSWWTMHGVRAIMNRIYRHAEGHGLWPEGRRNPASKARLGRKRHKRERRILSFEETARVLARLAQPCRLVVQTCVATGARISEVLGLKWKHVDLRSATVRVDERVWHQEVGRLKSEYSRRVLGIGDLAAQFASKALIDGAEPEAFVFQQRRGKGKPLWDSGVREALHAAARQEGCDFAGLGPHSFRRANITWRQEVGGSAIEASKIAGHNGLKMTSDYTFVTAERQNELTRRIQEKLAEAACAMKETPAAGTEIQEPASL